MPGGGVDCGRRFPRLHTSSPTVAPRASTKPTATKTITRIRVPSDVESDGPVPVPDFEAEADADGLTVLVSAATGSTIPYPNSESRPGVPLSTAVAVNRSITCFAVSFGYFARTSATTPATIAVELLVPVPVRYPPPVC